MLLPNPLQYKLQFSVAHIHMCVGMTTWDWTTSQKAPSWRRWNIPLLGSYSSLSGMEPCEISSIYTGISIGAVTVQVLSRQSYPQDFLVQLSVISTEDTISQRMSKFSVLTIFVTALLSCSMNPECHCCDVVNTPQSVVQISTRL